MSETKESEEGTTRIGAHTEPQAAVSLSPCTPSDRAASADCWPCPHCNTDGVTLTSELFTGSGGKSRSSLSVSLSDGRDLSEWTGDSQSAVITQHNLLKTLYFCSILISRFWNVEISLHFNLAFSKYSTSVYQAFVGQTEFSQVFNFMILSYSRNSRKFDAHEKCYVLQ